MVVFSNNWVASPKEEKWPTKKMRKNNYLCRNENGKSGFRRKNHRETRRASLTGNRVPSSGLLCPPGQAHQDLLEYMLSQVADNRNHYGISISQTDSSNLGDYRGIQALKPSRHPPSLWISRVGKQTTREDSKDRQNADKVLSAQTC